MTHSPAVIASRIFLDEVLTGQPPSIPRLIELLDRLLVSYHDMIETNPQLFEHAPPGRDWKTTYNQIGERFPDLGYYPCVDPTEEGLGTPTIGDAIDDLADIVGDLQNTLWYAENAGDEHANSEFRRSYYHWGQHARELLVLLHLKQTRHAP